MSRKALVPVNVLAKASEPTGQHAGDLFFKSTENSLYAYTGGTWTAVGAGSIDGGAPDSNYGGITALDGGGI
jgi:hypothetical protein